MAFGGMVKMTDAQADRDYRQGKYKDVTTQIMESWDEDYDRAYEWKPWGIMGEEGKVYSISFERACYRLINKKSEFSKSNMMSRHGLTRQRLDNWLNAFCEDNGFVTERVFRGYKFKEC